MANSELTKKNIIDLKMAVHKAHSLENELKKTRSELANARNVTEIAIKQRNKALQEMDDL